MRIENVKLKMESAELTVAVNYNEPLRNHTTFKIGGPVKAMYFPEDIGEMVRLCEILHEEGVSIFVMGNGSNILAGDSELDIAVINTTKLKGIKLSEPVNEDGAKACFLTAAAGVLLPELAVFAQENELAGLEFAHGIPGTLGGAVIMNAGAYGGEMKDVVKSTTAYSTQDGIRIYLADEHKFSYRSSVFAEKQQQDGGAECSSFILSSVIRLEKSDGREIEKKMQDFAQRRKESQPLDKPSAGSIFKRPAKGYAAELIENAGLKGYSVGGAQISLKHAGFIVNNGGATFDDVMRLIEHIQETVEKESAVRLEPEVKIWKS